MCTLTSCENQQDIESDIDRLRNERHTLSTEVNALSSSVSNKSAELEKLTADIAQLEKISEIYKNGKTPRYILKVELSQSHFTLDLNEHLKDAMNAIEFEIPVDKEFYNSVSKGTEIVDEFRTGSLIINGSFGDWEMKVVGKEIR